MGYIEFGNKHKTNVLSMETCKNPSEIDEKKNWTANCEHYVSHKPFISGF